MKIRRHAAASLIAITSTVAASGAVHAEQPSPTVPSCVEGTDHGVGHRVSRDGAVVTATVTGGSFQRASNSVNIVDSTGAVIASFPMRLSTTGGEVSLATSVDASGTTLTAEPIGHWRQISPRQRGIEAGQGVGMVIGALAGGVIGLVLGMLTVVLFPITALIGFGVGGAAGFLIGGAAGAAVPNSDIPEWDYVPDPPDDDSTDRDRPRGHSGLDHDPSDLNGDGLRDD
ncbi:hypothetical protein GV794_07080 [Nocardia cyriacigeorgica]|uniref:DUF8020 domain-containing protein n=2 Tax=Nocardia cyriacigeorgica TaxID=135487 RepID=A0ABX0CII7_9NOCA|nr:hypothetical protein [Nocardia cyriacigeorgica]NEW55413.1 hypothetical protein [Nocardia cyriacigeorgica]